jgi:hypothetical protein
MTLSIKPRQRLGAVTAVSRDHDIAMIWCNVCLFMYVKPANVNGTCSHRVIARNGSEIYSSSFCHIK